MYSPSLYENFEDKRYGALGNKYFKLFNVNIARAITANTRFYIHLLNYRLNSYLKEKTGVNNSVIYNDTDSQYLSLNSVIEQFYQGEDDVIAKTEFLDKFIKDELDPVIESCNNELSYILNALEGDAIQAEREAIADCLHASTPITVLEGSDKKILNISKFASIHGINTATKKDEIVDISHKNIHTASYNETTQEVELKKILNIQKKKTTKKLVKLILPNCKNSYIIVTEDHLIAVQAGPQLIYKQAKDITLDDDVIIEDVSRYNSKTCKLYNHEYINHRSMNCNKKLKSESMSKSQLNRMKLIYDERELAKKKEILQFNSRVKQLFKKHRNNTHRVVFRFCNKYTKNGNNKVKLNRLIEYINNNALFNTINKRHLLDGVSLPPHKRKKFIKKYRINKQRRGVVGRIETNYMKSVKNGFLNMRRVCDKIDKKIKHTTHLTTLNKVKRQYRVDCNRETQRTKKQHQVKDIHLVDKYNYNLDHIVSVIYGFYNNIPPVLIGHVNNLRVIPKIDNIKKGSSVDFNCVDKDLFKGYL